MASRAATAATRVFRPPAGHASGRAVIGGILVAIVAAAGVAVPAIVWVPRAIRYEVSPTSLQVMLRAGWWRVGREVPLGAISSARQIELGAGRRRVGAALPGYCVGSFTYAGIGPVWQATSCGSAAVLIEAAGETKPVVIAPADREAFLAALVSRAPATFAPPPGRPLPAWAAVQLVALAPLLLVPVLVATFFLAPGRLRYEVGGGELRVCTMIGAKRFPLVGATAGRCSPRRMLRIAGAALPGYYTGWYRIDGANARVFATRPTDGVLVAGKGRVFVTPTEAEAFLAELLRNGARLA